VLKIAKIILALDLQHTMFHPSLIMMFSSAKVKQSTGCSFFGELRVTVCTVFSVQVLPRQVCFRALSLVADLK
jgi:hypothetical protein